MGGCRACQRLVVGLFHWMREGVRRGGGGDREDGARGGCQAYVAVRTVKLVIGMVRVRVVVRRTQSILIATTCP